MTIQKLYLPKPQPKSHPMRLAIYMSEGGSNAKEIIKRYISQRDNKEISFEPVLIFTDNPNSNAHRIGKEDFKDKGVCLPVFQNPIHLFHKRIKKELNDMDARAQYDAQQRNILNGYGIDAIALAGYNWVVTREICDNFLTVNVHPGDLRVLNPNGKRKYIGLSWVPSAKAILDKQPNVYTSVHLVTPELDGGPLLALSLPQPVPEEALGLEEKVLLGGEESLKAVREFIKNNPEMQEEEIEKRFPIYKFASDCQERLKVNGDWVEFPEVIVNLSKGRYQKQGQGESLRLLFDNKQIPQGVVRRAA